MKENERQARLAKASNLKGTWELMKLCKGFLEEWEMDWVEGSEKATDIQDKRQQEIDKNERFKKIERKKQELNKKKVQTRINFGVTQLRESGKREWAAELRQEKLELQELRENMWRWRDRGGGKTRTGKEKMKEPDKKTNDKLKKLEESLERERQDQRKCEELRERERQETLEESKKRKKKVGDEKRIRE